MRCWIPLPRRSGRRLLRGDATRSCIMWDDPDTMVIWSACWEPGEWMVTTAIPTSAHPRRVSAITSGAVWIALPGLCQRTLHFAHQFAPGNWPLFQSTGAAHHGGQDEGGKAGSDGSAPLQYGQYGRLLAAHLARLGGGGAAGNGARDPGRGAV